jgi:hypothetical protein
MCGRQLARSAGLLEVAGGVVVPDDCCETSRRLTRLVSEIRIGSRRHETQHNCRVTIGAEHGWEQRGVAPSIDWIDGRTGVEQHFNNLIAVLLAREVQRREPLSVHRRNAEALGDEAADPIDGSIQCRVVEGGSAHLIYFVCCH